MMSSNGSMMQTSSVVPVPTQAGNYGNGGRSAIGTGQVPSSNNITCSSINNSTSSPNTGTNISSSSSNNNNGSSVSENVKRKLQQRLMEIQAKKRRTAAALAQSEAALNDPVSSMASTGTGWNGRPDLQSSSQFDSNWKCSAASATGTPSAATDAAAGSSTASPHHLPASAKLVSPISLRDLKVLTSLSYCNNQPLGGARDSHFSSPADDVHRVYCLECSRMQTDVGGRLTGQQDWIGNNTDTGNCGSLAEPNRKPPATDMINDPRICWQKMENSGPGSENDNKSHIVNRDQSNNNNAGIPPPDYRPNYSFPYSTATDNSATSSGISTSVEFFNHFDTNPKQSTNSACNGMASTFVTSTIQHCSLPSISVPNQQRPPIHVGKKSKSRCKPTSSTLVKKRKVSVSAKVKKIKFHEYKGPACDGASLEERFDDQGSQACNAIPGLNFSPTQDAFNQFLLRQNQVIESELERYRQTMQYGAKYSDGFAKFPPELQNCVPSSVAQNVIGCKSAGQPGCSEHGAIGCEQNRATPATDFITSTQTAGCDWGCQTSARVGTSTEVGIGGDSCISSTTPQVGVNPVARNETGCTNFKTEKEDAPLASMSPLKQLQKATPSIANAVTSAPILTTSVKRKVKKDKLSTTGKKKTGSVTCIDKCPGKRICKSMKIAPGNRRKLTALDQMTVAELKVECKRRSISMSGPKPNLLAKLLPFADSILDSNDVFCDDMEDEPTSSMFIPQSRQGAQGTMHPVETTRVSPSCESCSQVTSSTPIDQFQTPPPVNQNQFQSSTTTTSSPSLTSLSSTSLSPLSAPTLSSSSPSSSLSSSSSSTTATSPTLVVNRPFPSVSWEQASQHRATWMMDAIGKASMIDPPHLVEQKKLLLKTMLDWINQRDEKMSIKTLAEILPIHPTFLNKPVPPAAPLHNNAINRIEGTPQSTFPTPAFLQTSPPKAKEYPFSSSDGSSSSAADLWMHQQKQMDDLQKQFQKLQARLRRARQKVYAFQGTNDDPGTDFLLPHNTGTNNLNIRGGCIQHSSANTDVRNSVTMPLEEAAAGIMPEYCCLPEDNPVTSNHIESASPLKSGTETSFGSPDMEKVGYTFAFNDEAERSDMIEDDPANHRSVDDVTTYVPNYDVPDWCFLASPQMCYPTTPARDPPEYHEAIRLKQLQSETQQQQQQHQRQHILNASDIDETTSASSAAAAAQKLADGGIQMPGSAGGDDTSLSDPEFDDVFDILFRAKTQQPPLPFSMLPSDLRDLSLTNLESAADAFGQSAFYDDPLVNFPDQTFDSHPPSTIASSNPDLTSISHSNCSPAAQLSFKDSFAFPASAGTATSNSSADDDFDFTNNDSATDFDERFSFVRDILTKASTSGGNEVKPEVVESEASIRISSNAELMEWVDLLTQQSLEVDFLTDVFPEMHTNRSSRDPVLAGYKSKDYVDNFKFEVTVDRSNEDFVF